jgi:YbbR-like protein
MIAFLRDLVFRDFWLKLFSLGLAILIWVTVSLAIWKEVSPPSILSPTAEERPFYHVPVLVMSSAADVHDFRVSPSEVDVTVKGETEIVRKLEANEIRAWVDLTGIESAGNLRKRIDISTPPGVSLERVSPEEVQVLVPAKR